ncbi:MAG TPA: hypothetical protein VFX15_11675 [Actinomycetes bacterium]|nr:hypothetical protein [Actinomycetes bacterium]
MQGPRHAALIHSPLTTATIWGTVADELRARGWLVTVTEVVEDDPPYASHFIARTAQQLHLSHDSAHLLLIGHGAAGPLLPQVAFARQAAGAPVSGYLFVDALLPRTLRTATLLDVIGAADPAAGARLAQTLSDGGRYPDWSDRELAESVPDQGDRALLLASLRPHGMDFFTEPLPLPEDWPDAPCAYIQLSDEYEPEARSARQRGWPVRSIDGHHYLPLTNSPELADEIVAATE